MVYLAAEPRGALLSTMGLLGHTAAYFGSGVIIAFAYTEITALVSEPGTIHFVIGALLGFVLLWVAWQSARESDPKRPPDREATPPTIGWAFSTGAIINFIGLPFGVPYFVAIDQLLRADFSIAASIGVLAGYNLAYMLPFLIIPVLTLVMGENAKALLQRMNERVEKVAGVLLPLILGGIGIFLLLDAGAYFLRGEGLF
ncbi:MAG: GAP family protein, partial [Pseudomonadota bacterium]